VEQRVDHDVTYEADLRPVDALRQQVGLRVRAGGQQQVAQAVRQDAVGGRTRIDRIAEVPCGVPRLVSRPRKKPTKI